MKSNQSDYLSSSIVLHMTCHLISYNITYNWINKARKYLFRRIVQKTVTEMKHVLNNLIFHCLNNGYDRIREVGKREWFYVE